MKIKKPAAIAALIAALCCSCKSGGAETAFAPDDTVLATPSGTFAPAATSTPTDAPQTTVVPIEASEPTEEPTAAPVETVEPTAAPSEKPDYSLIKPYEVGQIMIIMYHGITPDDAPNPPYHRTISEFKADLTALYERGYRLCPLKDVMRGNIATEAGYTPVALTFDDGLSSAFSLAESEGRFVPAENTAYAILKEFYERHPDFGFTATFFINGGGIFDGAGTVAERLKYLVDNGFDIGNHTKNHAYLDQLGAAEIREQFAFVDELIRESLPGYSPVGISYPFGIRPLTDLRGNVAGGESGGVSYSYDFALREGNSGAPSAFFRVNFDPYNVPRVRGSDDADTDLWWAIRFYDQSPEYRYISDGDPNTIVVPKSYAGNVDYDKAIAFGKTVIEY